VTFAHIISLENLLAAWREFRRGKRHKPDVADFEFNLEDNLFSLQEDLASEIYKLGQYSSFFIRDPKLRHIHKATVRDRVLHQAVFRSLYPSFERCFIYDSYSCRLRKGTHAGVTRLDTLARKLSQNYQLPIWALKCDIRKFFDSVEHAILFRLLARTIFDGRILKLLEKIIFSFSTSPGKGLPLGNVTSQLFANIYLHELDWFMKHKLRQKFYLRYCDDFIILSPNRQELINLLPLLKDFLRQKLSLELQSKKITVRKSRQGIDFLGYVVRPHYWVLRTKTRRRFCRRLLCGMVTEATLPSYLGLINYCRDFKLRRLLLTASKFIC